MQKKRKLVKTFNPSTAQTAVIAKVACWQALGLKVEGGEQPCRLPAHLFGATRWLGVLDKHWMEVNRDFTLLQTDTALPQSGYFSEGRQTPLVIVHCADTKVSSHQTCL